MAVSARHPIASLTTHTWIDILSLGRIGVNYLMSMQTTESQRLHPATLPNKRFQLQRTLETPGPILPVLQTRKQVWGGQGRRGEFIICLRPHGWCLR